MKIKQGKSLPIPECTLGGKRIIAARTTDLLILDCYKDCVHVGRYLMNVETGEYGILRGDIYTAEKLMRAFEQDYWYGSIEIDLEDRDEEIIQEALRSKMRYAPQSAVYLIDEVERNYLSDKRWEKERRREQRIKDLMDSVPEVPEGFEVWAAEAVWKKPYPTYKTDDEYACPSCGKKIAPAMIKGVRHNDVITCACGKDLQIKKRGKKTEKWSRVMLIQETTAGQTVLRYFDIQSIFKGKYRIALSEAIRIFVSKISLFGGQRLKIYYKQCGRYDDYDDYEERNPANRTTGDCYLYPAGIEEALKGTDYTNLGRLLSQMASAGIEARYNKIMILHNWPDMIGLIEYLFKGRFYRLMQEELSCHMWSDGTYQGTLDLRGKTIEEIMRIGDRQKINRLRDRNGGELERSWLAYGDETDERISDAFLKFARQAGLDEKNAEFALGNMSPEQIMNYVKRQQDTSYPGKSASEVLTQWRDYLAMCRRLGKNINDEMVYRPRELKRRHDEAVEAIRKLDMIEEMKRNAEAKDRRAKELREKYLGAEEILKDIASRYEYENEEYRIIVPQNLVDIMSEGNALHHCVGSTDRYFERIRDQETYICFLRRQEEPELPYYTIEVEPGGTIRQHRGMYDEEPNIEEIRGFLREWQKVLKKRLHSRDWQLAAESKVKREQNLEELRKANNERVLKGLAEDFMEAV
jgi:hypothetical protein